MTPDEVEEGIDYIRNEVISLSIAVVDFLFTFWIEHSTGEIPSVSTCHTTVVRGSLHKLRRLRPCRPNPLFPRLPIPSDLACKLGDYCP